jgi:hypothetical protein
VPALRHVPAELGPVGQLVAIDDHHALEAVAEHASGAQPGHARADDDRGIAQMTVPVRRDGSLL